MESLMWINIFSKIKMRMIIEIINIFDNYLKLKYFINFIYIIITNFKNLFKFYFIFFSFYI